MPHASIRIICAEHASLTAMLRSLRNMLDLGPQNNSELFFDVLRGMLFYIDEVPERQHHPKESTLLFPLVARKLPHLAPVIAQLEEEHRQSESNVRHLQHLLLAWQLLGESRRADFESHTRRYIDLYRNHMRVEEQQILPQAEACLSPAEWRTLDAAFESNQDPLNKNHPRDPVYDHLYAHILLHAPAPVGQGRG